MGKKTSLGALKEHLDLKGENVLEIMLGSDNVQERYDAAFKTVQTTVEPGVWAYLKGQNVRELVEKQQTVEELEALDIKLLPEGFNEQLADVIDAMDFTIAGKVYLYGVWLQAFTESSIHYFRDMMRIRTEIIMRKKKSIITLP